MSKVAALREIAYWLPDGYEQDAARLNEIANQLEALIAASETASRYIHHCGANQTEKGEPHPQEELLDQLDGSLKKLLD